MALEGNILLSQLQNLEAFYLAANQLSDDKNFRPFLQRHILQLERVEPRHLKGTGPLLIQLQTGYKCQLQKQALH